MCKENKNCRILSTLSIDKGIAIYFDWSDEDKSVEVSLRRELFVLEEYDWIRLYEFLKEKLENKDDVAGLLGADLLRGSELNRTIRKEEN